MAASKKNTYTNKSRSNDENDADAVSKNRARYEHIAARMKKAYPISSFEERGDITKERITAKIKKIQAAYRKDVDLKGKSGGGRVVTTFYEFIMIFGEQVLLLMALMMDLNSHQSLQQWLM